MHGKDAAGPTATRRSTEMGTVLSRRHCSRAPNCHWFVYRRLLYMYLYPGTRVS